jgi:hypothetical protein
VRGRPLSIDAAKVREIAKALSIAARVYRVLEN